MRATEVFTPGKLPDVTYVDDHLKRSADILNDALEAGAAVISLSGPSKSGKTVFIEKTIGQEKLIQVTGAGVTETRHLWDRVFQIIGTPIPKTVGRRAASEHVLEAKAKIGGTAIVLSGEAELAKAESSVLEASESSEVAVDYLQLLIGELSGSGLVIFIDDFHYIPPSVQVEVSNQIKEAIRNDVIFVVASVPYHSDDAIRANPDLRGRTIKLDFDYWKEPELSQIARKGFAALEAEVSDAYLGALASEAAGSPQLMQSLCLTTCFENDLREKRGESVTLASDSGAIKKVCTRVVATSDYSSTVAKMTDGPRTRGQDRKSYLLHDGDIIDVYPLILRAIANNPPELTLRYPNLQRRIQALCARDQPSGSSVTGACSHIASIANASENRNIIEWDGGSDVLDIRDPYLLFYLRWGN